MRRFACLLSLQSLLRGSLRLLRFSPQCRPKFRRTKFITPIVVDKTPSKKKIMEIYENMKVR
ncbi:unnamed protein product [Gongylonema pulchrum]|uniref:MRPS18C n=1 Tax=Gongylonema pulchrum TaxID=637853 RepID=A0A183EDN8_9BILA|nr:unnamed protein product [Gongylonema pulchrum]